MNTIPDGHHEIKNVTGVYRKDGKIVVCGIPDPDDEMHNCDYMGCSSVSHVLFRGCCCQLTQVGYRDSGNKSRQKKLAAQNKDSTTQ